MSGNEVKRPSASRHPPPSEPDSPWGNGERELAGMSWNWFGMPESRRSMESPDLSAFSARRGVHDRRARCPETTTQQHNSRQELSVLNVRAQLIVFALLVIFSRLGLEGGWGGGWGGCPMLPPDMLPPSGS